VVARREQDRVRGQMNLFETCEDAAAAVAYPPLPGAEPWGKFERLSREKEMLGFYISGHPLERYQGVLAACTNCDSARLPDQQDDRELVLGGVFTQHRRLLDGRKNEMAFATLEDFKGTAETILFSDAFEKFGRMIETDSPVLVRGRRSRRDEENPRMVVDEIVPMDDLYTEGKVALRLELAGETEDATLEDLKRVLTEHPGHCPVWIAVRENGSVNVMKCGRIAVIASRGLVSSVEGVLKEEGAVAWEKVRR